MSLFSQKEVKNLLKNHGIRPSKGLGQNFLIDQKAVKRVIDAADLKKDDLVLEIGPGLGVLTIELAKRAKKVVAVEKDQKIAEILKETLKGLDNIEIIKADILKLDLDLSDYKIVANIPFYLTSFLIRRLLESEKRPKEIILIIQKEVAQRICAKPPKMNLLAVSVQFFADPMIVSYLSKKSFWPQPDVDGAIIKIKPKTKTTESTDLFFKVVKAGFSQPRKQLINNLSKGLKLEREKVKEWLLKNKIQPEQRAESLTLKDWINLTLTKE